MVVVLLLLQLLLPPPPTITTVATSSPLPLLEVGSCSMNNVNKSQKGKGLAKIINLFHVSVATPAFLEEGRGNRLRGASAELPPREGGQVGPPHVHECCDLCHHKDHAWFPKFCGTRPGRDDLLGQPTSRLAQTKLVLGKCCALRKISKFGKP